MVMVLVLPSLVYVLAAHRLRGLACVGCWHQQEDGGLGGAEGKAECVGASWHQQKEEKSMPKYIHGAVMPEMRSAPRITQQKQKQKQKHSQAAV